MEATPSGTKHLYIYIDGNHTCFSLRTWNNDTAQFLMHVSTFNIIPHFIAFCTFQQKMLEGTKRMQLNMKADIDKYLRQWGSKQYWRMPEAQKLYDQVGQFCNEPYHRMPLSQKCALDSPACQVASKEPFRVRIHSYLMFLPCLYGEFLIFDCHLH